MWLKSDYTIFNKKVGVFAAQFKVLKSNNNHSTNNSNHILKKKRKKLGVIWFLTRVLAIDSSKKTEFDSIKNNEDYELDYFGLLNS